MKEDIDKLVESLEGALVIFEDVKEAKESGDKITMLEGGALAIKHAGKALRFAASISEIGEELKDLDGAEAVEIAEILIAHFGGSEQAREATLDIVKGSGLLNQGVQKLIALKK